MSFRINSSSAVRSSVPEPAIERILVVSRWNVGWAAGSPGCATRTNLLSSRPGSSATCQANVTMVVVDSAVGDYLAPHLDLFHGAQAHYVAAKAAGQSALRPSLVRFGRSVRQHPGLLFTRGTMHLFRLWLRSLFRIAGRTRDGE